MVDYTKCSARLHVADIRKGGIMSQMVPPLSTEQRNAAWLIKLLKAPAADNCIMPHIFQPRPLLQAAQKGVPPKHVF